RVKNRSILRGRIEDDVVAVLTGIAIEHVDHLAADAVDHLAQSRVRILLQFIVLAIELLRHALPLGREAGNLVLTALAFASGEALAKIVDLLVHVFDFRLARGELGLQFRLRLLALGGAADGRANVDHADFAGRGRACRSGGLRADGSDNQKAGSGEGSRMHYHSGIHFILLIHWCDSEKLEPTQSG